ncbi:MAG: DNA-binding protein [Gammaproteobacteria bacterium]|nr:DNA-binding protein [Gammaproteobacteria bacterium]MBU0772627.1 DNA-binding protein [Gammaproteobacteria bacterium]MBU0857201.1 DNA-binding protein [Gammaproteobacteria bacterium]MBU1846446.1 DNA-binding protein [Gammaproteobacteria bacterium]
MMTIHIERLRPGDDLRRSLQQFARGRELGAGFILSAVGSLGPAMLRFAGRDIPTVIDGDVELLALSGTISRHGVHLHASVADAAGQVCGGHLLEGSIVRTTMELVLGIAGGWEIRRETDPLTGYAEMVAEYRDALLGARGPD